ncbi:HCP-like protein, partial [Rhizodiscina lignyota]
PVTHDELERLRATLRMNPNDHATALALAKRMVEASTVLTPEIPDPRARQKTREKYIFDAHKMVKKLVSQNVSEAMFYLADCYGQGLLGLSPDPKEAFQLYQQAAKLGHPASAYRTAVCCEMGADEGGGTRKDPLKAVQWYRRAASLGEPAGMYKLGMVLLKGLLGQQRNVGEAVNWLQRAADKASKDNPHALHELGLLYAQPPSDGRIIRDDKYAAQLFEKAARIGYKFSQFRLGEAFEYGLLGLPIDQRSSIAWYSKAAAQEEHQSELALSGWYLTGAPGILEQSDTEAYLWARKAAQAELPKGMFAMGYFTEVGIGCPRSLEEAKKWYGRAAALRYPKAQERLEELKKGGYKAQKSRERLSRTDRKQHDENCVVM